MNELTVTKCSNAPKSHKHNGKKKKKKARHKKGVYNT